jgi:tetratricopeptide (TPR) repeat protein
LGELSRLRGQLRQALAETGAALATLEELASSDPADAHWQIDLALVRRNVGEIQLAASNAAAALSSFESSLRILDERLEARPDDLYLQYEIAVGRTLLGDALEQAGGRAEARRAWREALDALEDQMGTARDPRVLAAWVRPLLRLGDAERAAPILQRLRAMGFRYPGALSKPTGGDDTPPRTSSVVVPDNPAPDGAPNSRRST